jgi:molybdate transport system ATP-binding protein
MSLSVSFRHRFTNLELQIEFEAPTPGVVAFFGPSGCGKSTIVMAAAGLLQPDSCRIDLDGTTLADSANGVSLPPEKRRIGLVFQDARLFPHMSVRSNLRFGMRRAPPGPIRLGDVVDLLGIGRLLDRRPRTLSGGERQRVAIGRALLAQPKLLAMDEPLASLDGPRKAEILPFLARLKTALALPILYVTHSPDELASLADTLILLDAGRVIAAGPLAQIVTRTDLPLANRDDAGAVLTARVVAHDVNRQLTALQAGGTRLWVPLIEREAGATLRVRVPAREVILASEQPSLTSAHNAIAGRVRWIRHEPARHETLVEVALDDGSLLARVTPDAIELLGLAPGREVMALIKSVSIEILPS